MEYESIQRQPTLPGIARIEVPSEGVAYLQAHHNYWQPGVFREPGDIDIAGAHVPPISLRTWTRRKHKLRSGELSGKDWLEGVWPPPRDWHPTWEPLVDPTPLAVMPQDGDGLYHQIVDRVYDPLTHRFLEERIIQVIGHLSSVAAVLVFCLGHPQHVHVAGHLSRYLMA